MKTSLIAKLIGHGVGRRKSSVARVWLKKGKGSFTVNGRDYATYFDTDHSRKGSIAALRALSLEDAYDITANIYGGGIMSQSGAMRLAVARALLTIDPTYREVLKPLRYISVDSRKKERKKPGQKAARAKFQFVKR
ncbi:MAG: 30S ribosomal protein S9 [Candidatus Babeliales bacterium]